MAMVIICRYICSGISTQNTRLGNHFREGLPRGALASGILKNGKNIVRAWMFLSPINYYMVINSAAWHPQYSLLTLFEAMKIGAADTSDID